jgi:hypothetical protein
VSRRRFISLLGSAAALAVSPLAARAQQAGRIYRIGFFGGFSVGAPGPETVMGLGYPAFRPLTMLFSRHTKRRAFITLLGGILGGLYE